MKMDKKKKGLIIGVCIFAALVIAGVAIFVLTRQTSGESKTISIVVTNSQGESNSYIMNTRAEYLRQAMDESKYITYSGTESEYGMMVEEINGERAVYAEDNAYWAIYVNGEYGQYGIDSQPVTDGDCYSFVYEVANY